ncbi:MAG: hypothetical protein ACI9LM_003320 [Alteromonadaceae bacterium]|jgi:hypothetical protein
MGRRRANRDGVMEVLFALVELNWKVGAFISFVSGLLTVKSFHWVMSKIESTETTIITALIERISFLLYLLPIMLLVLTIIFISSSYRAYRKENQYS